MCIKCARFQAHPPDRAQESWLLTFPLGTELAGAWRALFGGPWGHLLYLQLGSTLMGAVVPGCDCTLASQGAATKTQQQDGAMVGAGGRWLWPGNGGRRDPVVRGPLGIFWDDRIGQHNTKRTTRHDECLQDRWVISTPASWRFWVHSPGSGLGSGPSPQVSPGSPARVVLWTGLGPQDRTLWSPATLCLLAGRGRDWTSRGQTAMPGTLQALQPGGGGPVQGSTHTRPDSWASL